MPNIGPNSAIGVSAASASGTSPGSGGGSLPEVILVVQQGTSESLPDTDTLIVNRLINSHGYTVNIIEEDDLIADDLTSQDFVWVSGSVTAGNTNIPAVLRTANIPVLVSKPTVAADMDMTTTATINPISGLSQIFIENASSPVVAGKAVGTYIVYTSTDFMNIGDPTANAVLAAYRPGFTAHKTLFTYATGQTMYNSLNAPNKRGYFFLSRNIESGITQDCLDLIDAMIGWLNS